MAEKLRAKVENRVSIFNNCIANRNDLTLFYLVNLFNYDLYTEDSKVAQINAFYNLITGIENVIGVVKFSLFRFEEITSPHDYFDSFVETVRLWNPGFVPSDEFVKNIQYTSKYYCFLAINITKDQGLELEGMSLKDIAKSAKDQVVDYLVGWKQQNINVEEIKAISTKIENTGQNMIKPCPEKLLLSYYIKRMFPSYNIVLDPKDYKATSTVISYLQQTFTPHFNYFEMDNSGVEYFGENKAKTTYGTIIDIVEFPEEIMSGNFNFQHPGIVVNAECLTRDKARREFKRQREDIYFEEESAQNAGNTDIDLELSDYATLAEKGVALATSGRKIVNADIHILILSNTLEDLNKKRAGLISFLKNMNVVATFSPNQAQDYVDSYIKLRPKKLPFLIDLKYILSFQLENGVSIFDNDSDKFTSPVFAETTTASEATE